MTPRFFAWMLAAAAIPGLAVAAASEPRAGVARIDITPDGPVWMSGYAARTKPSEGVLQRIHAKALALEDGRGGRVVLVSMDLIGINKTLADRVAAAAAMQFKLDRSQILLNASHTHTGPMVDGNLSPMAPTDPEQLQRIRDYTNGLAVKLVDVIGKSLEDLKPAKFEFSQGEASFAINRRKREVAPVDHRVPVLRVTAPDGSIRAILFGYACHNTTLTAEFRQISGDYAGFAQAALEREFPGATALFFTLCAADQNPDPRSTLALAEQHGKALAAEVARLVKAQMKPVEGRMKTAFRQTRLSLANMKTVDYPVQIVRFERGFTLVALGGEVVVDYSRIVRDMFPSEPLVIAGYSNDVMCYIPSLRVLKEGGYEGGESMKWYGLDAPFAEDVEERIKEAIGAAMRRVKR